MAANGFKFRATDRIRDLRLATSLRRREIDIDFWYRITPLFEERGPRRMYIAQVSFTFTGVSGWDMRNQRSLVRWSSYGMAFCSSISGRNGRGPHFQAHWQSV